MIKIVEKGESLTDIPNPVAKTGYTVEWDRIDFTNVTGNITVTAIETVKTYVITLNANEGSVSETTITFTYGQTYTLPTPIHNDKAFDCWTYNGEKVASEGEWKIDSDDVIIVLTAQWGLKEWTGSY